MFRLIKILVLVFIVVQTSCNSKNDNSTEIYNKLNKNSAGYPIVRLQQQWFANSGFAGELFAKYETANKYKLELEIIPGSDQIDTKNVVMAGKAEFGVAGAEQILQSNENNPNAKLVIIGVINYKSLACFISKKNKGITKPKDFIGHKIGTMEGSPVDLIYKALKKKENLLIDKNDEIPTGWVLTGFVQDKYDVYPAFINDEPVTLKLKGIDVDIIEPSIYDVSFIGTVYFCKKELIDSNPELVQSFINSIADGWELTIKDPKKAIDLLKKYDKNIDEIKEIESLRKGMDYYKGEEGHILYTTESNWNKMADLLKSVGYIKVFDKKSSVENKFISWYHSKVKPKVNDNENNYK